MMHLYHRRWWGPMSPCDGGTQTASCVVVPIMFSKTMLVVTAICTIVVAALSSRLKRTMDVINRNVSPLLPCRSCLSFKSWLSWRGKPAARMIISRLPPYSADRRSHLDVPGGTRRHEVALKPDTVEASKKGSILGGGPNGSLNLALERCGGCSRKGG